MFTIAPIATPKDVFEIVKNCNCRHFYVYYDKFIYGNFSEIEEFILAAHSQNCKIFVNFKHDITEEDIDKIRKFMLFLTYTKIDGIFINGFTVLEAVKNLDLTFEIIADSYFDIHNIEGIKFVNGFGKINKFVVTEEVYTENLKVLKSATKMSLATDSDNLPWCSKDLKESKAVDAIVIKGKFAGTKELINGIKMVEGILSDPKSYSQKRLPFKHLRNCYYQTNHFSGEIINLQGEDFKFSKYIKKYHWKTKLPQKAEIAFPKDEKLPRINLRLSSLSQINELEKFIRKTKVNPVFSIEYGEIINTSDLAKNSMPVVMLKVSDFCKKYGIKLEYGTPRILIERDFDRVFEDAKNFCKTAKPDSVIINNIGFFNRFVKDEELKDFPVEIGTGINLLNSMSIMCLNDIKHINSVDFTSFRDISNIKKCIKRLGGLIENRKLTIAGNIRVPSLGLCPLNANLASFSRLSCKAKCHEGTFAIEDPNLQKIYPFIPDGFCRMHMFKSELLDFCKFTKIFEEIGINEFVIDMSCLTEEYLPILLTEFINSLSDKTPAQLPILTEHLM